MQHEWVYAHAFPAPMRETHMQALIAMQLDLMRRLFATTADGALAATEAVVAAQASAGRSMLVWQSAMARSLGVEASARSRTDHTRVHEVSVMVRSAGGHAVAPAR